MPSFDIAETEKLKKWLADGMKKAAMTAALSAAMKLTGIIQNELIPGEKYPPIFDNAYRAGWIPQPTKNGAEVVNTVPYAAVIEFGARPDNIKIGRAMIDALAEWVRRKGLAGASLGKTGKSARAPTGDVLVESRRIAWAIAKSMQGHGDRSGGRGPGIFNHDGKKGLRIAERASKRAPAILLREMSRELKKALK